MNELRRHIPNFCTGARTSTVKFQKVEELIQIDFIKAWINVPTFYRLSKCSNLLMVELKGGTEWWVIGYIKDPNMVDLPIWEAKNTKYKGVINYGNEK